MWRQDWWRWGAKSNHRAPTQIKVQLYSYHIRLLHLQWRLPLDQLQHAIIINSVQILNKCQQRSLWIAMIIPSFKACYIYHGSWSLILTCLCHRGWYLQILYVGVEFTEKVHHRRSVHAKKEMESYTVLNVLPEVISNVANTIDPAEKVGIRVDW